MSIEVHNISKMFGDFAALKNVSLRIPTGELVALLGPSGSGKTTLLRIIAGLEIADPGSGAILFYDEDISKQDIAQRRIGFVFQHYSLFRHMSIFENVAFGLKVRPRSIRPSNEQIRRKVTELLKLVQLERVADLYPSQLSGGQRQRIALIRALAVEPKVLLLDEPFGALDAKVRRELRRWLRRLHDELSITSVFVTHDQDEALEVSDRIAVMNEGIIEQEGTPDEVYDKPANPFVYNFLGNVNLFHGRVDGGKVRVGEHELTTADTEHAEQTNVVAYVRPHDIEISRTQEGDFTILATIRHLNAAGPLVRILLQRHDNNEQIEAELTRDRQRQLNLKNQESVYVRVRNPRVFVEDYVI
jgi:sulfate/thiosulfate transport system ATP-binding protein